MNLDKAIRELRAELDRVNETITAVERISQDKIGAKARSGQSATPRKRGRPPGSGNKAKRKA